MDCLKSPRQHDLEQDDNCATKPFQITIDVTNTDTLADQFKKAKTDHKNVFSALFQGVELLLVSGNGNGPQTIQLTTDDFVHNSDNDYSKEHLVSYSTNIEDWITVTDRSQERIQCFLH